MTPRTAAIGMCWILAASMLAGGCEGTHTYDQVVQELADARAEARRLQQANEALQAVADERKQQIATLQRLGEKRLDRLYHVTGIELGRYTNGIDLDGEKPGDEAVKVYLRPIDQHGSTIKAAGEVTVELYDLAAEANSNLVGKYHWDVEETAKQWSSSFVAYHYSFLCRLKSGLPRHKDITVRVRFTDYLTGKTFTAQKLCQVRLPPATQPAK